MWHNEEATWNLHPLVLFPDVFSESVMTHNQVRNNEPRLGYHFDGGASTHLRHTLTVCIKDSSFKRFVSRLSVNIYGGGNEGGRRRRDCGRGEKSRPVRPTRRLELYKLVTQCWPPCNISPHRPPPTPTTTTVLPPPWPPFPPGKSRESWSSSIWDPICGRAKRRPAAQLYKCYPGMISRRNKIYRRAQLIYYLPDFYFSSSLRF